MRLCTGWAALDICAPVTGVEPPEPRHSSGFQLCPLPLPLRPEYLLEQPHLCLHMSSEGKLTVLPQTFLPSLLESSAPERAESYFLVASHTGRGHSPGAQEPCWSPSLGESASGYAGETSCSCGPHPWSPVQLLQCREQGRSSASPGAPLHSSFLRCPPVRSL